MRARAGRYFEDKRGWGRYAGMEIAGGKGWHRHLLIITVYGPPRSGDQGSAWQTQVGQMQELTAGGAREPFDDG